MLCGKHVYIVRYKIMKNDSAKKKLPFKERLKEIFFVTLFIILIPLILVLLIIYGIGYLMYSLWLGLLVKLRWYPQGKNVLFVYSNSPNWKEYIENNILNRISDEAVIINWSERNEWNWKSRCLELKIFKHWTRVTRYSHKGKKKWDGREFNPVAITFAPWWKAKVFRFWKAFKNYKHGKDQKLKELESKLFKTLNIEKVSAADP